MLNLINVVLGSALLVAGRKLFWLFVGVAGFLAGLQFAAGFSQRPGAAAIIIGLVVGVLFALLAIFLQTIAIGAAGFFAGGYVLTVLAGMLHLTSGGFSLPVYLIGGVLGVILVLVLFDWALITLSSLAGAALVTEGIFGRGGAGGVLFFALFIAGVLIQGAVLRRARAVR